MITVGIVNKEAMGLINSVEDSDGVSSAPRSFVVKRNTPNPGLSLSISCEGEGAVIGDVSIGDSEIRFCNDRLLAEHEISLANKLWSFAKNNLGVLGRNHDEVYSGKIKSLEIRDRMAKGRKGKKISPQ